MDRLDKTDGLRGISSGMRVDTADCVTEREGEELLTANASHETSLQTAGTSCWMDINARTAVMQTQ